MNRISNNYQQQHLMQSLQDPDLAVEYLNAALAAQDETDPTLFLRALKNVAEAWGFSHLADLTGLDRAGIYRMLSAQSFSRSIGQAKELTLPKTCSKISSVNPSSVIIILWNKKL